MNFASFSFSEEIQSRLLKYYAAGLQNIVTKHLFVDVELKANVGANLYTAVPGAREPLTFTLQSLAQENPSPLHCSPWRKRTPHLYTAVPGAREPLTFTLQSLAEENPSPLHCSPWRKRTPHLYTAVPGAREPLTFTLQSLAQENPSPLHCSPWRKRTPHLYTAVPGAREPLTFTLQSLAQENPSPLHCSPWRKRTPHLCTAVPGAREPLTFALQSLAEEAAQQFLAVLADGRQLVVVDVEDVRYLDAAGVLLLQPERPAVPRPRPTAATLQAVAPRHAQAG